MPLIDVCLHGADSLPLPGQMPEGGFLLLWRIDESEEELERLVTAEDRGSASRFRGGRKKEHLAWRAALRTVVPEAEIHYNSIGAPYLEGLCLGVSHTHGLAAVRVSKVPCGVDVELAARDMSASRARFVSVEEEMLADASREDFAISVWCAKEVMYKMSGHRGLNFARDLQIEASDLARGTIGRMNILQIYEWIVVYM